MKLFVVTLFVGFTAAAQLTNRYLPPGSASTSGGHGGFLQGPHSSVSSHYPSAFGEAHSIRGGGATHSVLGSGTYKEKYHSEPQIPILKYDNVNNGDGSYHFEYLTGNGISQHEQGHLNNPGSDHEEQVVEGSYSYTGDDGRVYTVHYRADSNGFQAFGDHLPTPPPIPEAIQKSIEYNAAHGGSDDSGAYDNRYDSGAYQPQRGYIPPKTSSFNTQSGYHY